MSFDLADNGVRLRWSLTPTKVPQEVFVFSMYTGKRSEANYPELVLAMADYLDSMLASNPTSQIGAFSEAELSIDEWQNPILSADSWATAYTATHVTTEVEDPSILPAQCSVVISRETDDQDVSRRRRRNRSYIGPIPNAAIRADGQMDPGVRKAYLDVTVGLNTALSAIPVAGGVGADLEGLCNVSYEGRPGLLTPAQIMTTDRLKVGSVIDTQRSRRNAVPESYFIYERPFPTA